METHSTPAPPENRSWRKIIATVALVVLAQIGLAENAAPAGDVCVAVCDVTITVNV
ncbi:hypothetical protein [Streptomyces hydrogenans]|uniref:hypothetical protein n=1 Tax=Streptomyces hydrogenans TaxID=1873719 RepID=UPI0037F84FCA